MEENKENNLADEKLQLEIDGLKNKNSWDNSIGKWIPVITALIAVLGFLSGIIGYVVQQRQLETERANTARKLEEDSQKAANQRQKDMEQAALERESREKESENILEENRNREEKRLSADRQMADNQLAAEQKNMLAKMAADQKIESKRQNAQQDINLANLQAEISKSNKARTFETQKPYLEKQMQLYFDAAEAAAMIATSLSESEKVKAEQRFWVLFWGPLAVVEDALLRGENPADGRQPGNREESDIERAMVNFGDCSSRARSKKPSGNLSVSSFSVCESDKLDLMSLCLAYTIRDTVHKMWGSTSRMLNPRLRERCGLPKSDNTETKYEEDLPG